MDPISTTVSSLLTTISPYALDQFHSDYLVTLIVGFIVAFCLSCGIGANDVANTFGTSVGAKVISLRNACIVATIFEMLGAILVGYKVSDTIRKGIIDVSQYEDTPAEYMLGNLAALGGSATWLILATFLKMPISGTHSIVGAVLGFSLVSRGMNGINWYTLGKIVGSWFVSPVLSGLVSSGIFFMIRAFILRKRNPIEPGLRSLPVFYGLTLFINVISILLGGPDMFKIQIEGLPKWTEHGFAILISSIIGLLVALFVYIVMVPKLRRTIADELLNPRSARTNGDPSVLFMIGNETAESSKNPSPLTGSLDDFTTAAVKDKLNHNTLKAQDCIDVKSYITTNTNGVYQPLSISNTNASSINTSPCNSETGNLKTHLELIPMDGLSPNSSAVPLIKNGSSVSCTSPGDVEGGGSPSVPKGAKCDQDDQPGVGQLFSFLQILTAAFGSFAHGGNDVSNAIGPLIALWLVYQEGTVAQKAPTPMFLLIYGGIGISLGLWIWGRRVIKTMGEDLTKITPSSGFTIEIGAAITVLLASKIGLPVSTTHCKVGSVVSVGWIRSEKGDRGVDWRLFRNIIFAWLVTVPVSGGVTALFMLILKSIAL